MCDGVNRGNKARMAARSAVYGALRYINAHCFEQGEQPMNTHVSHGIVVREPSKIIPVETLSPELN